MQCREFREVSESYLSDELLVETNHQIAHHLEHCPQCRADFAARRSLRQRVMSAGLNADEFKIDPAFRNALERRLKEDALKVSLWGRLWSSPMFLVPAAALLVFAFSAGIFFIGSRNTSDPVAKNSLTSELVELAHLAAGDHRDCALEKLQMWERMSSSDYPERAVYTEKVLAPLDANYSRDMEMLSVHDCLYQGKLFKHVVLKNGSEIVSVFFDGSGGIAAPVADPEMSPITSEVVDGLQVASFQNGPQTVLVVSGLPEPANVSIARTLSGAYAHSKAV